MILKKIVSHIVRGLSKYLDRFRNVINLLYLNIKYPNSTITFDNYFGRGCVIKCTVNSKLKITNSSIDSGSVIISDHGGDLNISNSFIGRNCVIVARHKITIEPNCQIAEMVVMRDQNHKFGQEGKTILEQGFSVAPITIKENVWLGAKVTVTAGSSIGENTVVGSNAVVLSELEANAVYVGVPAKKVHSF